MTEQFGAVKIKRTRRTTAGKSRYINFAQDSKGRIVSWGYWGKNKTLGDFAEKIKTKREKIGGAKLQLVITIQYTGRKHNFFIGEIQIDAEYNFMTKDKEVTKSFVEGLFKNNSELIKQGIKVMEDYTGDNIRFNGFKVQFNSHVLDSDIDAVSVDAKVYIRGLDKTREMNLASIILYVENELEGIE